MDLNNEDIKIGITIDEVQQILKIDRNLMLELVKVDGLDLKERLS